MPLEPSLWNIRWGQVGSTEVDGGFALSPSMGVPSSETGEEGSAKGERDPLETWQEIGDWQTLKGRGEGLGWHMGHEPLYGT